MAFNKNNIGDVAYAVSYLATIVQNAHGYIMLQEGKNGGENRASVTLIFGDDSRFVANGVTRLEVAIDFERIGIPADIAAFLGEIPFTGEDTCRELLYRFQPEEMNEADWADEAYVKLRRGANDTKYGYDIGGGISFSVEVARKGAGTIISFSIK
ncbi:MAG: hypothetical protein IJ017_07595 [Oscillospiraceae bacterium]|nr:hypothetical protein [Oscillospiraceae bacterium]